MGGTIILVCDTSSSPNTHSYKISTVTELLGVQETILHKISKLYRIFFFFYNNQRGVTQKLHLGDQSL